MSENWTIVSIISFKTSNDATKKSPVLSTFKYKMLMSEAATQERF